MPPPSEAGPQFKELLVRGRKQPCFFAFDESTWRAGRGRLIKFRVEEHLQLQDRQFL